MKYTLSILLILCTICLFGQKVEKLPEFKLSKELMEENLRWLASDELLGRRTGTPENDRAAAFIAEEFRKAGVKFLPGMDSYFQPVPFVKTTPAPDGTLSWGEKQFSQGEEMIVLSSGASSATAQFVYAGLGQADSDYENLNAKDKIVIVQVGQIMDFISKRNDRLRLVAENGAKGLIEIYNQPVPWQYIVRYFNSEQIALDAGLVTLPEGFFHVVIDDASKELLGKSQEDGTGTIEFSTSGCKAEKVISNNVVGMIPGKNKKLRDEYVLLTAHYDHVGAGKAAGTPYTPEDSIFNGARDNAFGTVGILSAARAFSKKPPARSVILAAVTGEEIGLLGSKFLSENSPVPLEKIIFNLNNDGAGYNDTTLVGVIGYGRVGIDPQLDKATGAFGLEIVANPAPEQNLFDRSDNVNFASKGIPAPTFAPGFRQFDEEVMQYYHTPADEADAVNFNYLHNFTRAFVYSARLIADMEEAPRWQEGDKYEEAGKALYGY